jgi:hypothetical protein
MTAHERSPERLSLRASEAAKALGISERKFRDIQHRLPHVHLDGVRVFPIDALREWLAANARIRDDDIGAAVEEALRSVRRPRKVEPDRARAVRTRTSVGVKADSEAG